MMRSAIGGRKRRGPAVLALILGCAFLPAGAFYISGPPGHRSICGEALAEAGTVPAAKIREIAEASTIPDVFLYPSAWHFLNPDGRIADSLSLIRVQRDQAVRDAYNWYLTKKGPSCARTFGLYLHAVQDFYANTNWVDYLVANDLPLTVFDMNDPAPPDWLHCDSNAYPCANKDGPADSPLYYPAYRLAVAASRKEWVEFGRRLVQLYPAQAEAIFQANGFPAVGVFKIALPDGSDLVSGHPTTIGWSNFVSLEAVRVSLFRNGRWLGDLATLPDPDVQFYHWTAGQCPGGNIFPGFRYQIRVSTLGGSRAALSPEFLLAGLRLVSPNGGEHWTIGSLRPITWDAQGVGSGVILSLWRGGRNLGEIATVEDAAAGAYAWWVGSCSGRIVGAGSDYRISIVSRDGKALRADDLSDGAFTLER
jgi:hypothetical protein